MNVPTRLQLAALLPAHLGLLLASCAPKPQAGKQYRIYGRIVSLDSKERVATVDGEAVPNWMEAMTMEYPVKNSSEFKALKVGESIQATLNVRGPGDYDLTEVEPRSAASKK